MGIESMGNSSRNIEILPENPAGNFSQGSGNAGVHDFDYQISVAESLLSLIGNAANALEATGQQFYHLVQNHDDLMRQYFDWFIENNLRPRIRQIGEIYTALVAEDTHEIKSIIESLMNAKHGFNGGQQATKLFASVTLGLQDGLSQIGGAMGAHGQLNDYETQINVALNLKRILVALQETINTLARKLNQRVQDHDDLMRQDFDKFISQCAEPRMQQLSDLWRSVANEDIPEVERMIRQLQTASGR